jgi:hypothetical protein
MRTQPWTLIVIFLATLIAGAALAQDPDGYEVLVRWTACARQDDLGTPLAAAIRYDVFIQSDGAQEVRIAQVADDTTAVVALAYGQVHRVRVVGFDDRDRPSPPSEWSAPVYYDEERSDDPEVPGAPVLPPNAPNPFNPSTRIAYGVPESLPASQLVTLEIFSAQGQRVRSFTVDRTPGFHEIQWDGTDQGGRPQSTGVYLTRFTCGDEVQTRKMTMVK